jgi:ankyrin repeat protein
MQSPTLGFLVPIDSPPRAAHAHAPSSSPSEHGRLGMVRLLLKHGADPNAEQNAQSTAVHLAARKGFRAVVSCMAQLLQAHPLGGGVWGWGGGWGRGMGGCLGHGLTTYVAVSSSRCVPR